MKNERKFNYHLQLKPKKYSYEKSDTSSSNNIPTNSPFLAKIDSDLFFKPTDSINLNVYH